MVNKGATVENGLGKPENLIKLINHDEPPGIKHVLPDNPSFFSMIFSAMDLHG